MLDLVLVLTHKGLFSFFFGPSSLKGVSSIQIEDNIYKNKINTRVGFCLVLTHKGLFCFFWAQALSWELLAYT